MGRFFYAPESPYSRPLIGTTETVSALGQHDVIEFYHDRFGPATSAVLLVGAVDERLLAAVEHTFGAWESAAKPGAAVPTNPATDRTTVYIVDRPGSVQSELRIGHVGLARHHPDFFPVVVMNAILGGLFTSRLNLNLREKHGFTYGARSAFAFRRYPGPFVMQAAVANDVTARAVEESLREVDLLRDNGATIDEVIAARDFIIGIQPLELQTTEQLAVRLAEIFTFDLPDDYFDHFRRGIAEVTPDDVKRVAVEHIHPDRFAIVVVGSAEHVEKPLRDLDLGPVLTHRIND
jgi:zinc protease